MSKMRRNIEKFDKAVSILKNSENDKAMAINAIGIIYLGGGLFMSEWIIFLGKNKVLVAFWDQIYFGLC